MNFELKYFFDYEFYQSFEETNFKIDLEMNSFDW